MATYNTTSTRAYVSYDKPKPKKSEDIAEVTIKLEKESYNFKVRELNLRLLPNNGLEIDGELLSKFPGVKYKNGPYIPRIKKVIYDGPATIVKWADDTKTVVKCGPDDVYSEEAGLSMAIAKKALGNDFVAYERFKKAFRSAVRNNG